MTYKTCADSKDQATCAPPLCKWFKAGDQKLPATDDYHCISKDRFSSSYTIATDNCLTVRSKDGCANLATICEWKSVKDATTTTPVVNPPVNPAPTVGKCVQGPTTTLVVDIQACIASTDPKSCDPTKCVW